MVKRSYKLIITLNVNGLNAPTERHRLARCIQKQDPYIFCLQNRKKVRGWKKVFHANVNKKRAGVAILISDKIDFKVKTITREMEGHHIMIKWSI